MPLAFALVLVVLSFAVPALADPYAVGSQVPPLALADQHGAPHPLDASVRVVVFSREMKAGGVVKTALEKDGAAFLEANRALYLSDVSGMPGLVRSMFALPGLRRRSYRIALDTTGEATKDFPSVEGKPTVLVLDGLRVVRIENPATPEELRRALETPQPR
jgi:hypothetical protein